MATQWKVSTANTVTIDLGPYDVYGATGFQLHYKLKGDTNTTDSGELWAEVTHDIQAPVTFDTNGITPIGSATIEAVTTTGIAIGQVYKAGAVYVYISGISGTTLTLRRLTTSEIAGGTTFTQVGNTGIYETSLTLGTLGQYTLLISNPSVGLMNEATKVEVVANTIDDVAGQILTNDTSLDAQLAEISSALGVVDTSISGKLII